MSRGEFLVLGGVELAGAVFLAGTAGCGGGEGRGSPEVAMTSEPEEPESMQEAVETPTPRGPVKGILHPLG